MKKIIVVISVCLSIVACKERVKTDDQASASANDSLRIVSDSITGFVNNDDSIESEIYPQADNLPLSVLTTGGFHNDEASPEMINKGWFGIFRDRGRYYIAPTTLTIKRAFDAISDDDESDPSKWTGWEVKTSHIDTSLVLISGSPHFSSHEIKTIPLERDLIEPNGKMAFQYNGVSFTLYATADIKKHEYNEGETLMRNYKLYLRGNKGGKEINQLLASSPYFDDAMFGILLIGDIDNDGFPDLVLNTTHHYNVYRPTVYLSSFAEKDQLVKVVGLQGIMGC